MLEARTISISIDRDWQTVYESVWRPQDFARWASGLSESPLVQEDTGWWKAEGPDGPIRILFTEHNAFGVMDHSVDIGSGTVIYVPMRIVANGEGSEVLFTLFRQPGMSDEKFAADAEWVARDLLALRALLTSSADASS